MMFELLKRKHLDLETVALHVISSVVDFQEFWDSINITSIKSATAFMTAHSKMLVTAQICTLRRIKYLYFEKHFWANRWRIFWTCITLLSRQLEKQKSLNASLRGQHGLQSWLLSSTKYITQHKMPKRSSGTPEFLSKFCNHPYPQYERHYMNRTALENI